MRTSILYAAVVMTLFVGNAAMAADKGLVHRVGKMEETIFGTAHRQHSLPERIDQLEKQTLGTPQPGPLSKRLEQIELTVNGKQDGATATVTPAAQSHVTAGSGARARAAKVPRGQTRTAAKQTTRPVTVTTSDYMPPIAPQLDPRANHSVAAEQVHDTAPTTPLTPLGNTPESATETASNQMNSAVGSSEVNELIRKGTAAHQSGNPAEAEKIFKDVLIKSPFNSNACFNLGAIAEDRGDLAAALGNYRTALIGAPNDTQIQEAIAQVESQISQKQDSPFKNPLGAQSIATNGTLLRGNATEFDPLKAQQQAAQTAQAAQTDPPPAQAIRGRSGWRTAGALGAGLIGGAASGAARGALRGAMRGGGNGAISGAISSGGRGALRGVLRATTSSGLGGAGGAAILNGLHCPLCRLLPF